MQNLGPGFGRSVLGFIMICLELWLQSAGQGSRFRISGLGVQGFLV